MPELILKLKYSDLCYGEGLPANVTMISRIAFHLFPLNLSKAERSSCNSLFLLSA